MVTGTPLRAVSREHKLAAIDQVLSSGSNAVLPFVLARAMSPRDFGFFMVSYSAYILVLALGRSALSTPVALAAGESDQIRGAASAAIRISYWSSPWIILLVAGTPILAGGAPKDAYLLLGVGACLAAIQDVLRFSSIAHRVAWRAVASDAIWMVMGIASLWLGWAIDARPAVLLLVWVLGPAIGLVPLVPLMVRGSDRRDAKSNGPSWRLRIDLALMTLVAAGSVTTSAILVARLAGPDTSGALACAGQLMAPISMCVAMLQLIVLPEAARRTRGWSASAFTLAGGALAILSIGWALSIAGLSDRAGTLLLGASWPSAQNVLPVVGLTSACVAAGAAAAGHLLRIGASRRLTVLRLLQALMRVGLVATVAAVTQSALKIAAIELVVSASFIPLAAIGATRWRDTLGNRGPLPEPTVTGIEAVS